MEENYIPKRVFNYGPRRKWNVGNQWKDELRKRDFNRDGSSWLA
jgi:hypothetical protein